MPRRSHHSGGFGYVESENSDITDDSSDEEFSDNILQKFSSDSKDVDSVTEDPDCSDKENQEPSNGKKAVPTSKYKSKIDRHWKKRDVQTRVPILSLKSGFVDNIFDSLLTPTFFSKTSCRK